MVRLEVEEFEGRDQDPAAVIGPDLETPVRRGVTERRSCLSL